MKIGFLGILTLIFVIAKLFGYIDWSWWLVLSPAIIGTILSLIIIWFAFVVAAFSSK